MGGGREEARPHHTSSLPVHYDLYSRLCPWFLLCIHQMANDLHYAQTFVLIKLKLLREKSYFKNLFLYGVKVY